MRRGLAVPVVSARVTRSTPAARTLATTSATDRTETSSKGEPKQHDTTASTATGGAPVARMPASWSSDSATVIPTFLALYPSLAETVTVSCRTPLARASSAPRTLGTRAHQRESPGSSRAPTTSAAPAIAGTAFGETNEATSTSGSPAAVSASTSAHRSVGGHGRSPCNPSRGPQSRSTISVHVANHLNAD